MFVFNDALITGERLWQRLLRQLVSHGIIRRIDYSIVLRFQYVSTCAPSTDFLERWYHFSRLCDSSYRQSALRSLFSRCVVSSGAREIDPALRPAVRLHRAGDLEGADRAYRAYLQKNPGSVEARSNLGAVLAGLGKYEQAIAEYKIALRAPQESRRPIQSRSRPVQDRSLRRSYTRNLPRHTLYHRSNKQIMLLLGDCYLRQGQNRQVIDLLDR